VVLGVDPEHRHGADAARGGDVAGQLDRRDGLVERVQRPAEHAGLLAGHDGDGVALGKEARRGDRRGRRFTGALLRVEQVRQPDVRAARAVLGARDRLAPGVIVGGMSGVERREAIEGERVVGRESADPRQLPEIDGQRACRRRGSGR
jgi:hypothetical protein